MKFIVLDGLQKPLRCVPPSGCSQILMLHKSICAKLHTFHTVAVFYVHFLCVCIHKHNCMYVVYIYLFTFFWERCKGIFALGFSSNSVAKMLLLSSLLLGFKSITSGEHPRVVQYLYSKYGKYHKYQRSKCLYPYIRLIPQTIQFPD